MLFRNHNYHFLFGQNRTAISRHVQSRRAVQETLCAEFLKALLQLKSINRVCKAPKCIWLRVTQVWGRRFSLLPIPSVCLLCSIFSHLLTTTPFLKKSLKIGEEFIYNHWSHVPNSTSVWSSGTQEDCSLCSENKYQKHGLSKGIYPFKTFFYFSWPFYFKDHLIWFLNIQTNIPFQGYWARQGSFLQELSQFFF